MVEGEELDLWALCDLETPWCLRVVATLGIADRLASGSTDIAPLAQAVNADADALGRVLRHLVNQGVFAEPTLGRFALNAAAEPLRADHPASVRLGLDLAGIGGRMAGAWSGLLEAVRSGRPAYAAVFGRPFWDDLDAHPEIAASFDALMGPGHGPPDPEVLLAGDWDSVRTVVDVGGGTGMLLAAVLQAHPDVRGTLVDQSRTVARAAEVFQAAGVAERVAIAGQSFFAPLPAGADLYLMKNVLADWPDAEAGVLLRRCATAARPTGRVVVIGGVAPDEDGGANPELLMLTLVGGKNRRLTEFRALAGNAGLAISATGRQPSGHFVVECRTV